MNWNGSGGASAMKKKNSQPTKVRVLGMGLLITIAVIIVGVALVAYLSMNSDESRQEDEMQKPKSGSVIKDTTPSKPKGETKVEKPEKQKPKAYKDMTPDEKLKYYQDKYGDNLPDNLKPIVYYLKNPPRENFKPKPHKYDIFKRSSERTIGAFLLVEPGEWMLRAPTFGARFDNDLAQALTEQIEFSSDDTQEQRELKQAVIDTKKELAERIAAGEKGSDILNEAAKQLYELGKYRRELEETVNSYRRDGNVTDEELADYVAAANVMLEKRGAKPLKMPNLLIRHAALKLRAKKAATNAETNQ